MDGFGELPNSPDKALSMAIDQGAKLQACRPATPLASGSGTCENKIFSGQSPLVANSRQRGNWGSGLIGLFVC